jgi:predicted phage terminase large subunit-like protein
MELLSEAFLRDAHSRVPRIDIDYPAWLQLRDRGRRDLWFLAKDINGKALTEETHRRVTDFFIAKDNAKPFWEHCDQFEIGLLLYPRGSFKSTIDVCDVQQAIINWPLLRTMILTETDELAESFIGELKDYFLIQDTEHPTLFQQLYPEFCAPAHRSNVSEFVSVGRQVYRDAYLRYYHAEDPKEKLNAWAASLGANPPGFHCDLLKIDDAITPRNSRKEEQRQKAIQGYDEAAYLVDPGGHIDLIGTRYHPKELYARIIERATKNPQRFRYLMRPAWKAKPHALRKTMIELEAEDVELLFEKDGNGRDRLTYKKLREALLDNPQTFASQYLNDPVGANSCPFTREQIAGRIIPYSRVPKQLVYYIAWDFAYSPNGDYSVGVVGGVDAQGNLYIVELIRGWYSASELAFKFVDSYARWNPRLVLYENSNGASLLMPAIEHEARQRSIFSIPMQAVKVDTRDNAKYQRVVTLQPLMEQSRLWIADTVDYKDALLDEFSSFTGERGAQDDIPDAISYLASMLPAVGETTTSEAFQEAVKLIQRKKMHALIFDESFGAPAVREPEPEPSEYDRPVNYFGI